MKQKLNYKGKINKFLEYFNLRLSKNFPRAFQKYVLNEINLIGVEIGVWKGENALSLLTKSSIKKLYLIDPYKVDKDYTQPYLNEIEDLKDAENIAKYKLRKFDDKIVWIKKFSNDAIDDVPNGLDFVYIDGNHRYEFVKKDIENYYPKVKKGGFIGGHDFEFTNTNDCSVSRAVLEFVINNDLRLFCLEEEWWIIKK